MIAGGDAEMIVMSAMVWIEEERRYEGGDDFVVAVYTAPPSSRRNRALRCSGGDTWDADGCSLAARTVLTMADVRRRMNEGTCLVHPRRERGCCVCMYTQRSSRSD